MYIARGSVLHVCFLGRSLYGDCFLSLARVHSQALYTVQRSLGGVVSYKLTKSVAFAAFILRISDGMEGLQGPAMSREHLFHGVFIPFFRQIAYVELVGRVLDVR